LTGERIGLFGLFGVGNLGNDGSLAALLDHLRSEYPNAVLDAFCGGPDEVRKRHGIGATPMHWTPTEYRTASTLRSVAVKALGKVVDAWRTAAWVRRHDVVIVPGTGVLEATLPIRPWGFPYALFLLTLAGRLFGTRVALVSVGASKIDERAIRALVGGAARLAFHRTYRDTMSRDAMRAMGVDTARDEVYPDLVFGLTAPAERPPAGVVGVGVMAFRGANGERAEAEEIYRGYVGKLTEFVRELLDDGRKVRLFVGDRLDHEVVADLTSALPAGGVSVSEAVTLEDLLREMSEVDVLVATRYHNVMCALRLAKPTLSVGYSVKNDVLMAEFGMAEFCLSIREFDLVALRERFAELERRAPELRETMAKQNVVVAERLEHQFAALRKVIR
jgi:polysaccharide pyruvyl transferase WcaK-like protein